MSEQYRNANANPRGDAGATGRPDDQDGSGRQSLGPLVWLALGLCVGIVATTVLFRLQVVSFEPQDAAPSDASEPIEEEGDDADEYAGLADAAVYIKGVRYKEFRYDQTYYDLQPERLSQGDIIMTLPEGWRVASSAFVISSSTILKEYSINLTAPHA